MSQKQKSRLRKIVSWLAGSVIFQALVLALIIRSFVFQPFSIPSGSMKPTLLIGDYVFVTKWSYGFSRHSLPLGLPLFSGRIFAAEPERGDIIVFKFPRNTKTHYIKRLIGLPGDRVQLRDSKLYVNNLPLERFARGKFEGEINGRPSTVPIHIERMANGREYQTIDVIEGNYGDTSPVFEVPQGHYFFMGDNRDNSADSRYDVGTVPAELLVGKARFIFLSLEGGSAWQIWRWPSDMRWNRFFTGL